MTKAKKAKKEEVAPDQPMKRRGRPAAKPEDRILYHPYGVNVPMDLWVRFKARCDASRRTYSEVGVELIEKDVEKYEKGTVKV